MAPRHACNSAADVSSIQFVMPFGELLPDDDKASRFLVLSMRHVMVWVASSLKGLSESPWTFKCAVASFLGLFLEIGSRNAVETRIKQAHEATNLTTNKRRKYS